MSNQEPREEPLLEEFQALGKNLVEVLRSAWDSPERKRLQDDIENGLAELGNTIRQEADNLSNSKTGQQLKQDFDRLGEKMNTSETPEKIRQEVLKALHTANSELQKIIDQWKTGPQSETENAADNPEDVQDSQDI